MRETQVWGYHKDAIIDSIKTIIIHNSFIFTIISNDESISL